MIFFFWEGSDWIEEFVFECLKHSVYMYVSKIKKKNEQND